jgi:hypothetical protein
MPYGARSMHIGYPIGLPTPEGHHYICSGENSRNGKYSVVVANQITPIRRGNGLTYPFTVGVGTFGIRIRDS